MSRRKGRTDRNRKLKQTTYRGCSFQNNDGYKRLLQWMKKEFGFKSDVLSIANFTQTGRGIAARKFISDGDHVISIPKSALIGTNQAVEASLLLQSLVSYYQLKSSFKITGFQALCVFLIEERRKLKLLRHKNPNLSKWSPYVRVLPKDFSHPLYWDQLCISLLPYDLQNEIRSIKNKVEREWNAVRCLIDLCKRHIDSTHLHESLSFLFSSGITYMEYRWAWCCINTRCVYCDLDESEYEMLQPSESDKYCLVPFLDLLNHSPDANVKASFNRGNQRFEIVTFTRYRKFEQVFINYGNHSNEKLLLEYGFVSLDGQNKNDVVKMNWNEIIMSYELQANKLAEIKMFLRKRGLDADLCFGWNGPSWSLTMTVIALELVNCRLLDQCKISRVKLLTHEIKDLQRRVQERLSDLAKKKLACAEKGIEKCIEMQSQVSNEQKSCVNIAIAYWKSCRKVISSSIGFHSNLDLSDCDFISCAK